MLGCGDDGESILDDDDGGDETGETTGDTTDDDGTTMAPTTGGDEATDGTATGATGADDTTTADGTTGDGTTGDGTTGDGTTGTTGTGSTGSTGGVMADGFGNCVDDPCMDTEECFTTLGNNYSVCSLSCETADDCPMAPPGGNAPVGCIDLAGIDGTNCAIQCDGGQTCPDDMSCQNSVCVWDFEVTVLEGFGDCTAGQECLPGETCVQANDTPPITGACAMLRCETVDDCPQPPAGDYTATVTCDEQLENSEGGECFLDCSDGQTCPDGMICLEGTEYCAFQEPA